MHYHQTPLYCIQARNHYGKTLQNGQPPKPSILNTYPTIYPRATPLHGPHLNKTKTTNDINTCRIITEKNPYTISTAILLWPPNTATYTICEPLNLKQNIMHITILLQTTLLILQFWIRNCWLIHI